MSQFYQSFHFNQLPAPLLAKLLTSLTEMVEVTQVHSTNGTGFISFKNDASNVIIRQAIVTAGITPELHGLEHYC